MNGERIARLHDRDHEVELHERIVRARVENVLHDLRWLVEEGRLDANNNAWRFALNAQANAQALARKIGL